MATKYETQRARKTPPHVSLGALRAVAHLTLDEVCARVSEYLGDRELTRGALSAIENGHRGASADVLRGLEVAYGLRAGDITTDYEPRNRDLVKAAS
jgi:transcriptional regulator with XRE-family HTH domain